MNYNGQSLYNAPSCLNAIRNAYNSKGHKKYGSQTYDIYRDNKIYNYNKTKIVSDTKSGNDAPIFYATIMNDGTYLGVAVNGGEVRIGIDINGESGPNRLGHDIFLLTVEQKDDTLNGALTDGKIYTEEELDNMNYKDTIAGKWYRNTKGNPCNTTSQQTLNGIGCSWYALRDICPTTNSKGYFECLPK